MIATREEQDMNTSLKWVLSAVIATALATPALSQSKEADQKYCNALAETYLKSHGQSRERGNLPISLEITQAMDACKSGNTASAIPTLEKHLREINAALPSR
jgi:outer membrane PBP1 activator LpoA protein